MSLPSAFGGSARPVQFSFGAAAATPSSVSASFGFTGPGTTLSPVHTRPVITEREWIAAQRKWLTAQEAQLDANKEWIAAQEVLSDAKKDWIAARITYIRDKELYDEFKQSYEKSNH